MSEKGNFFAIGKAEWAEACALGMNPAAALLVMARGTARDNVTTTWSCQAVYKHTGMTWRRARDAIGALEEKGIVNTEKAGARPMRSVRHPGDIDQLIWLPNELVTGAGAEIPPVARLRQAGEPDALQLLVELYGEHELAGDGGLPRSMLKGNYERKRICGWGQFDVYGFSSTNSSAWPSGPLKRYWETDPSTVWERIGLLQKMGLIECVSYLAESNDPEAELVHALSGDDFAQTAADAAAELAGSLPGGFHYEAERFEYVLPVLNHMQKAAVVDVYRLRYRPKTSRTSAWLARHVADCEKFTLLYGRLARAEFTSAA